MFFSTTAVLECNHSQSHITQSALADRYYVLSAVISIVCTCFSAVRGGIQHRRWVGRAAVFMYQYSKRTLNKTTASPVGPSARRRCSWMLNMLLAI